MFKVKKYVGLLKIIDIKIIVVFAPNTLKKERQITVIQSVQNSQFSSPLSGISMMMLFTGQITIISGLRRHNQIARLILTQRRRPTLQVYIQRNIHPSEVDEQQRDEEHDFEVVCVCYCLAQMQITYRHLYFLQTLLFLHVFFYSI